MFFFLFHNARARGLPYQRTCVLMRHGRGCGGVFWTNKPQSPGHLSCSKPVCLQRRCTLPSCTSSIFPFPLPPRVALPHSHPSLRATLNTDLYWQYTVEHGNSRSIHLAQGPIHQFTNLSALVWERKAANLSSLLSIDHTLRLHFSV